MIPEDDPGWRLGRAAALIALALVLFLPSVWNRDLWDPDEPRYAEVTRQMEAGGDLLVPRFNGQVYSEKPPLFFWASLLAQKMPGIPPGSGGRLVGALASMGTLLLTWRIGALLMGEATGALAAALLSGCILFWHLAQSGVIDPLLAFLTTASLYGFTRHLRRLPGGMVLFYGAASLAVLAKGPVGLIVPGLAALSCSMITGGRGGLTARHALWGLPMASAPALLWLLAAAGRAGPGYLETMVVTQNVGRAVSAYVHREPIWYYALTLPFTLMPLTPFLPRAMIVAWKERICGVRPMLLPLTWFASSFLFFSLVSSKKSRYMLVLAPAAALLVAGWLMRRFVSSGGFIREGRWPVAFLGLLCLVMALALLLPVAAGTAVFPEEFLSAMRSPDSAAGREALVNTLSWPAMLKLVVPGVILAVAGMIILALSWRRRVEALTAFLAAWTILLAVAGATWPPAIDAVKSSRAFATLVKANRPPGPLFLLDDNHPPGLNFYMEEDSMTVLRTRHTRIEASRQPGAGFIGNRRDMDRISGRTGIVFEERRCLRLGEGVLCLAAGRPPSTN